MKPPKNWNPFKDESVVTGMHVAVAFLIVYILAALISGLW